MKNGALIGGGLWALALLGSFYWGRSHVEEKPHQAIVESKKTATRSVFDSSGRSREVIVAEFEPRLLKRDDIATHDELWLLADEWAAQEPETAVAWMNELKFDDVRNPYLFAALSQWASQEPERTLAWLKENRPEQEESELYLKAALIRGMAKNDPDAAIAFLIEQPKSLGRSTIDFVLGAWAQEGVLRVITGISKLPTERVGLRALAFEKAVDHLSPEMLDEVREYSMTHGSWEERNALQKAIADRWGQRDPKEALAWAEEIPSPNVTATAAKHWARQQPLEASAWLATRRDTPAYDLSARAVAWSVVGIDPQLAFSQVAGMKSKELRLETFEQMGRFWISDQPVQARQFLEGDNPLPPELREALLSHFE